MFRKIRRYIRSPYYSLGHDLMKTHPDWMCDRFYIRIMWKDVMGCSLDLNHPKKFTEKIQWLKLNYFDPIMPTLVDKYEVKSWVANKIGDGYVIPTIGIYNDVDEMDFAALPSRFVAKCTHDCASVVLCDDKVHLNVLSAKSFLKEKQSYDYYKLSRERPYHYVAPRIIVEEHLGNNINDYKFYCFHGKVKLVKVNYDKASTPHANFYDPDGNMLRFGESEWTPEFDREMALPGNTPEMIALAEKLADDFPFVRVDFYSVEGKIYFGEMTFYPDGGFSRLSPLSWDYTLGEWLDLNQIKKC